MNDKLKKDFLKACKLGDISTVKSIVEAFSSAASIKEIKDLITTGVGVSCLGGKLEVIDYLLVQNKFSEYIDIENSYFLEHACMASQLETVKYLLTNGNLKEHCDIHLNNDSAVTTAAYNYNFDVICYLLKSPDLKTHANLYVEDGQLLRLACIKKKFELIDFLLLECDMELNEELVDYIQIPHREGFKYAASVYHSRELQKQLENNLENNTKILSKNKV